LIWHQLVELSWFVGDIFGTPLAIEGIMAFFSGIDLHCSHVFDGTRSAGRFHLASSWLTAIGANLSALWILVANSLDAISSWDEVQPRKQPG